MDLSAGVADLHLHTTASDGTCSVADRVTQAGERGLEAVAVTDHDCVADELDAGSRRESGVELITGVEVRAGCHGTKTEILGYYVDPDEPTLASLLERVRGYRRDRNEAIVDAVVEATGIETSYEALAGEVEGALGRPHVAERLVDADVVDSIGEAFDRYLGRDGACYVPMERAPAEEVVAAIAAAGGASSLAHPGRTAGSSDDVAAIVEELAAAGLDGIEVWYPYERTAGDDRYADIGVEDAMALADRHDLVPTGGSDCHGPGSGKYRIGDVRAPATTVEALRAAADH